MTSDIVVVIELEENALTSLLEERAEALRLLELAINERDAALRALADTREKLRSCREQCSYQIERSHVLQTELDSLRERARDVVRSWNETFPLYSVRVR